MLFMSERGSLFDMNINNPSNEILFVCNICLSLNNNKKKANIRKMKLEKEKKLEAFELLFLMI